MKAMRKLALAVVFLTGCGGSMSATSPPPPVTTPPNTFSDASITGEYGFEDSAGLYNSTTGQGPLETLIGSFTSDGKGNITSGSEIDFNASFSGGPPNYQNAYFTIIGNYTVNQDGTGTVQFFLTCVPATNPYLNGILINVSRCSVGTVFTVISPMTIAPNGNFTLTILPYQGTLTVQVTAKKGFSP
jgi:hypothetical protein